jgi:cyclophilin family peptidyl-prolyl cis-trans isomerase
MRIKGIAFLLLIMFALAVTSEAEQPKRPTGRFRVNADTLVGKTYPIRDSSNSIVTLETDYGKLVLELYRDVAPAHADSFLARVEDGFYDSTQFHRIIKDFMIQGGNPFLAGKENVEYYLPDETSQLPHQFGTLSMASRGHPTTAQTQFFICLGRNYHTKPLDGRYVVFGQLLTGFDVLYAISVVEVTKASRMANEKSQPVEEVWLRQAYRSDAEGNRLE